MPMRDARPGPRSASAGPGRAQSAAATGVADASESGVRQWSIAAAKVIACLVLPLAGPAAGSGVYLLLAVWALGGPRRSIEALTLTWLLNALNPGVYSISPQSGILRWVVIAAAILSVFVAVVRHPGRLPRTIHWLWGFGAVAAGLSLLVSYAPDVSLFKIVIFVTGASAILMAFHLTRDQGDCWRRWFLTLSAVFCLASLPLIVSPVGYLVNGTGFQGLTYHPQTYGVFLAPFVAWLPVLVLTETDARVRRWFLIPLLTIAIVSLVATQARTGVLAAGAALALIAARSLSRQGIGMWVRLLVSTILLLPVCAIVIWLNWESVNQAAMGFVLKREGVSDVSEAFYQSRGGGLEVLLQNFTAHPWTGIGFGVSSNPATLVVERDPFIGLPISAPVEKGFTLFAVLEEVGIPGFLVFCGLVGSTLAPLLAGTVTAPTAFGVAAILTNFGEAMLFALSGNGLLVWLLIGAARAMKSSETVA